MLKKSRTAQLKIALAGRVEPECLPPRMRDELLAAFRDWRGR